MRGIVKYRFCIDEQTLYILAIIRIYIRTMISNVEKSSDYYGVFHFS